MNLVNNLQIRNIVALATAPANAALAVIRLSGPESINIFAKVFYPQKKPIHFIANNFYFGKIQDPKTNLFFDEVIALIYRQPKSFTGENTVEIITHGNMLVVEKLLNLFVEHGAQFANKGEFSQQAFLNNKIDLLKADSINNLILAANQQSRIIATKNLLGNISQYMQNIKQINLDIIGQIEVSIDYPEYNEFDLLENNIILQFKIMIKELKIIIDDSKIFAEINNQIKVAIIGKPNVGKSSLLNALINENKAIVSNVPGTTRDIVEGEIRLQNLSLKILDTAGLRHTKIQNESLGIKKTKEVVKKADLILYVTDNNFQIDETIAKFLANKSIIYLQNKMDKYKNRNKKFLPISAKQNEIKNLISAIEQMFYKINIDWESKIIFFDNNIAIIKKLLSILENIQQLWIKKTSIDLILLEHYTAYKLIQEILGENIETDLANKIFAKYCIGK